MTTTRYTGDPFVDLGALVIETLEGDSLEEKIRFITDVYVDKWDGKLHQIFMNSKITNPSIKMENKKREQLKVYLDINDKKNPITRSYCRICTREGSLYHGGRNTIPLAGSGSLVNFHHFHEEGILICSECLLKLYFFPLGLLQGGKEGLFFLQIQNKYVADFWRGNVIIKNVDDISRGTSKGIRKGKYQNPISSLIVLASELIDLFGDELPEMTLRGYFFSNFGADPNVKLFDLPNYIFAFLKIVFKECRSEWLSFVKSCYRLDKNKSYDEKRGEWVERKKNAADETLAYDDYAARYHNRIYQKLFDGRSILPELRKQHQRGKFPIGIAILYLIGVRKMRKEQIELIQNVSSKIIELSKEQSDFKKFIVPIQGARFAYQLRAAILKLIRAHYLNGEHEPFIRSQEYIEYLFPDGQNWHEVRDFLLICLYERLHDLRVDPTEIASDEIAPVDEERSVDTFNVFDE